MARPTKYNKQRADLAIEARASGMSLRHCANYVGVAAESLRTWLNTHEEFLARWEDAYAQALYEAMLKFRRGDTSVLQWIARTSEDYRHVDKTPYAPEVTNDNSNVLDALAAAIAARKSTHNDDTEPDC